MKRIILSAVVAFSISVSGCGSSSSINNPISDLALSTGENSNTTAGIGSGTIINDASIIVTDKEFTSINLIGEMGSVVYINGIEYATFDDSGKMVIELFLNHNGSTIFNIIAVNKDGIESQKIVLEVIKKDPSSSIGVVQTAGEASALTVSQSGTMFIAEKDSGVEIISVGFNDKISSDLLSTISGFSAVNVILSDDENKLYVEDESGKYHIMDISDISNPIEIGLLDEIQKSTAAINSDATKRYRVSSCGLVGEDISDKYHSSMDFIIKDKAIKDVVLVEDDTKLLTANGEDGLVLYSLEDEKKPTIIGQKNLNGNTSGLSLIKQDGILFVANGENGVEIFNLDILLHEMQN